MQDDHLQIRVETSRDRIVRSQSDVQEHQTLLTRYWVQKRMALLMASSKMMKVDSIMSTTMENEDMQTNSMTIRRNDEQLTDHGNLEYMTPFNQAVHLGEGIVVIYA